MPRPKGSKNKAALPIDENIAAVTAEIESLQEKLKEKKTELKKLNAEKEEEDKKRLIEAILASGKNVDEVIAWIGAGEVSGAAEITSKSYLSIYGYTSEKVAVILEGRLVKNPSPIQLYCL